MDYQPTCFSQTGKKSKRVERIVEKCNEMIAFYVLQTKVKNKTCSLREMLHTIFELI